ncbi:MAG TPA: VOC family protein [Candidatus Kapabacteria bacterium]|nr:VOC family protein [Candidatus Kapabacteria bacterium]
MNTSNLSICLWFEDQAEEAVDFYTSIFPNSSIGNILRYGSEGFEYHQKTAGSIMTIEFALNGMNFLALNGGPIFKFSEATSVIVNCDTQEEIDNYWNKLTEGGQEGPCGWLKDKFGVSWQVAPTILAQLLNSQDKEKAHRVSLATFHTKLRSIMQY